MKIAQGDEMPIVVAGSTSATRSLEHGAGRQTILTGETRHAGPIPVPDFLPARRVRHAAAPAPVRPVALSARRRRRVRPRHRNEAGHARLLSRGRVLRPARRQ